MLLETKHASNLVSLIAPVDPTSGRLLKWDNNFSWTYNGDMADSIKERVKAAGGAVEAADRAQQAGKAGIAPTPGQGPGSGQDAGEIGIGAAERRDAVLRPGGRWGGGGGGRVHSGGTPRRL